MFERLVEQAWQDVQDQIHQQGELAGLSLEPVLVDNLVRRNPTLDIQQSGTSSF